MMKKVIALLTLCCSVFAEQPLRQAQGGPNILLIVTDDQGYGDLSCHGNTMLETPNLDRLAEQSVRFENFHVAPCCAPTRAALLTGRNHHEAGVWGVHWARDYMSLDETTIAEVLRDAGYDTGMIGKWHSGRAGAWLPWNRGFNNAWVAELYRHKDPRVSHNGKMIQTSGYADKSLADIAIDFVQKDRGEKPWFLLMASMSPHGPWVAPPDYVEKYKNKGCSERFAILNGMIDHMDAQLGRLIDSVDAENTLVIFISDNGPIHKNDNDGSLTDEEAALRNPAGMRGVKGNIWENATRVPCFIRWSDKLKPSTVTALADVTDIFPTLLDIAAPDKENVSLRGYVATNKCSTAYPGSISSSSGGSYVATNKCSTAYPKGSGSFPLHGRSLVPLLKGNSKWKQPRELFKPYWRPFWNDGWSNDGSVDLANIEYNNQLLSYYQEPYKLVSYRGRTPELYNLTDDRGETTDIAAAHPELVQTLGKKMRDSYDAMVDTARCWKLPRFHIGHSEYDAYDTVGEVLAGSHVPFCSSVKDEGNVVCKSHNSKGWKTAGDAQTILVDVVTPGRYDVTLDAKKFAAGTKVKLQVGDSELETVLPRGRGEIEVGQMDLKSGAQDLRLSIVSAPKGSSDAIELMKMAVFKKN